MDCNSCLRWSGSRRAAPDGGSCWGGRLGTADCTALLGLAALSPNSLRLLRSATFKQAATSQSKNALRAEPQALRCSSPQKSPPPGTARRECNRFRSSPHKQKPVPQRCVRAGRRAPLRRRGAELWGRRACALQQLTRRGCLNEMSVANGVSSAARPQSERRSGVGGTPSTASAKPSGLPGRAFACADR